MALCREQIDHLEHKFRSMNDKPYKSFSHSRKWLKNQINRFIRREGKVIADDDKGNDNNWDDDLSKIK